MNDSRNTSQRAIQTSAGVLSAEAFASSWPASFFLGLMQVRMLMCVCIFSPPSNAGQSLWRDIWDKGRRRKTSICPAHNGPRDRRGNTKLINQSPRTMRRAGSRVCSSPMVQIYRQPLVSSGRASFSVHTLPTLLSCVPGRYKWQAGKQASGQTGSPR